MNPQPPSSGPSFASPPDLPGDDVPQWLSALADGECSDSALEAACGAWRQDDAARATWHAYHLIGDVMRSEELAADPAHDTAFLARFRDRIAAEPVVLAPQGAAPSRRVAWRVPAAMAAGFAVVAGVLVLTRGGAGLPNTALGELAAASSPVQGPVVSVVNMAAPPSSVRRWVVDQGVLRDPRLDEFLRAHQAIEPGAAMAVPGGGLRQVDVLSPADTAR